MTARRIPLTEGDVARKIQKYGFYLVGNYRYSEFNKYLCPCCRWEALLYKEDKTIPGETQHMWACCINHLKKEHPFEWEVIKAAG